MVKHIQQHLKHYNRNQIFCCIKEKASLHPARAYSNTIISHFAFVSGKNVTIEFQMKRKSLIVFDTHKVLNWLWPQVCVHTVSGGFVETKKQKKSLNMYCYCCIEFWGWFWPVDFMHFMTPCHSKSDFLKVHCRQTHVSDDLNGK